jgi:mannose-1-phosphate guanylyltransferase
MNETGNTWALVLAAGEGSRLRALTTAADGLPVPKQYCSLRGGPSLLHEALQRATAVAPPERICVVVAAQHRHWWTPSLDHLPAENVIVQPQNRGTAHGILLPLLHIAARDPDAVVVLLPADHYLRDEDLLAQALRGASAHAAAERSAVFLLGVAPDEPDTELGYIVPARRCDGAPARVLQFVEKPASGAARALLARGALWNAFVIAGSARALLGLYRARHARTVASMRAVVESGGTEQPAAAAALYAGLPAIDFSRDVLAGQESALRVLAVPQCGWTDLGTPRRVAETLRRLPGGAHPLGSASKGASHLNLDVQSRSLERRDGVRALQGAVQ